MKKYSITFSMVFSMGLMAWAAHAQSTKPVQKKPESKPTAPVILPDSIPVPKFSVRFGPYNGKLITLVDDMKKLAGTELIVTDQQGQQWTTIAFRFGWNKKELTDDIKTGRRKTVMNLEVTDVDGNNKLPEAWQNSLKKNLQSGEQLTFEKIIIEHPGSKRKMMAPALKLTIQ